MESKEGNAIESRLYKWQLGRCIGKGTCSQVLEAIGRNNNVLGHQNINGAVKIFKQGKKYEDAGTNEVEILQYLSRQDATLYEKYVVCLLDHFSYNSQLCLVYEKLCCNLHHILLKNSDQGLPLFVIKKCSQDVLGALNYLADQQIIHGDLKLTNIMWNANKGCFQLVDFGLSFHKGHQRYQPLQSPGYEAPEAQRWNTLIAQDDLEAECTMCSYACDMWSFGCVLLYMYTGKPLYRSEKHVPVCAICSKNSECTYTSYIKQNVSIPLDQRNITSDQHQLFMDLVMRMMKCKPEDRISPEHACNHKSLADYSYPTLTDLLLLPTKILQLNNMFQDSAEISDPEEHHDIVRDIEEECGKFGSVEKVMVPLNGKDCPGKVFVQYLDADGCSRAQEALCGRTFNENIVVTSFFPAEDFESGNFF